MTKKEILLFDDDLDDSNVCKKYEYKFSTSTSSLLKDKCPSCGLSFNIISHYVCYNSNCPRTQQILC